MDNAQAFHEIADTFEGILAAGALPGRVLHGHVDDATALDERDLRLYEGIEHGKDAALLAFKEDFGHHRRDANLSVLWYSSDSAL